MLPHCELIEKQIFERVLEVQIEKMRKFVGNTFTEPSHVSYLARRQLRIDKFVECLAMMVRHPFDDTHSSRTPRSSQGWEVALSLLIR
jgi:hypothetical protein